MFGRERKYARPKVLIVGPYRVSTHLWGGVCTVVHQIADSRLSKEFHIKVFDTAKKKYEKRFSSYNVFYAFIFFLKFLNEVIAFQPHVVHIHTSTSWGFYQDSFFLMLSRIMKRKILLHMHGGDFESFYMKSSSLGKKFIAFILRKTHLIIALSESWRDSFLSINDHLKVSIVKNCIDIERFSWPNKRNISRVLSVGALDRSKGIFDVIPDSISLIINENIRFVFAGNGNLKEVKKLFSSRGISSRCEFLGALSEVELKNEYALAGIFILPSYAEGVPMVLLEAMSYGLPVIATSVGGIPEVIEDAVNGFLIKPGDAQSLAEKIEILASDESLARAMGEHNLKKIKEEYNLDLMLDRISQIYREALAAKKRSDR